MRIVRPKALHKGDVIGICTPASPIKDEESLERAVRYLEGLGYRVEFPPHFNRKRGYLAGSDAERADDLHKLFSHKHVRAIFAARGGYGTQRILPLLNYSLIRKNPKILVGYSDITALQFALFKKAGLVSLAGPLAVELPLAGKSEELFWHFLTSKKPPPPLASTVRPIFSRSVPRADKIGRLLGGNLSLISAMLGSSFMPPWNRSIIFLEEIDERPYRIDRTLLHMTLNGVFAQSRGLILGAFSGCKPAKGRPSLTVQQVFRDVFGNAGHSVVSGFRFGHVRNSLTIPFGARARIDGRKNRVIFLEAAVS